MNAPGYEQLSEVLRAAFDQAAYGKGAERHARGNDFDKQHMQTISTLLGTERGMAFQVCKKLTEGLDMEAYDRFERELLGVIIYTAGIIIWRKKNSPPTAEVVKPDVAHCPHCGVGEGVLHLTGCELVGMAVNASHSAAALREFIAGPPTTETFAEYEARTRPPSPIDPADVDISDEAGPSEPNPDLYDWQTWKQGDLLVCEQLYREGDDEPAIGVGDFVRVLKTEDRGYPGDLPVKVNHDVLGDIWPDHEDYDATGDDKPLRRIFRFHSRPTK